MLYEALYVHEGEEPFPSSILEEPQLRRYVADFGSARGDVGVVALDGAVPVGACWVRTFSCEAPGYGWVDEGVPELTIAVVEAARGRSLGAMLIDAVLHAAAAAAFERVCLSVDPRSPALRLYERVGFVAVGRSGTSITMVRATSAR